MSEMWKDIEGYEGLYQVSDLGRVRSKYVRGLRGATGDAYRILKRSKSKPGYPLVHLYKPGRRKTCQIHTLVIDAFVPRDDSKTQVNHLNGDKNDARLVNLERCTQSENMKHAYVSGLSKKPPTKRKLSDKEVLEIYSDRTPNNNPTLAKKYGVDTRSIWSIKNGKTYAYLTSHANH